MSQTYDYFMDTSLTQNTTSSKYFGYSIFFHVTLMTAALFVTVPALQKMNEPITIEIAEINPPEPEKIKPLTLQQPENLGAKAKPTRGAKAITAPQAAALQTARLSDEITAPVKKSTQSKSKFSTIKTTTGGGKALLAKSAPSRAGVPETIEDIAAPDLDYDTVAVAQVGALGEDEFENEFKNIDHKSEAALRAQKSALDNEARMISDEQDQALAAIENENAAQARAMKNSLEATRTKNAAALAQVRASEEAARAQAARDAAEKAQALAARKGQGQGEVGRGAGAVGDDRNSKIASGSPNGIRSVDSLRQMPGNPKPKYSSDERLRREQGKVIFYAFVTPEGNLQNFKLVQSTGFRNLDGKTLSALKKWRFYPGQQGWVEIPQIWSLKGDVQEMPTLLRRQVSQR